MTFSNESFTKKEISKFSKKDAEKYTQYNLFLEDILDLYSKFQDSYPLDPKVKPVSFSKRWADFLIALQVGKIVTKAYPRVNYLFIIIKKIHDYV